MISSAIVLDTAAFVTKAQLHGLADVFYTTPDVLKEVRDASSLAWIQTLSVTIQQRVPTSEALQAVVNFAKLTGDFPVLSMTDLRVMALAYTVEKERKGTVEHLRTYPLRRVNGKSSGVPAVKKVENLVEAVETLKLTEPEEKVVEVMPAPEEDSASEESSSEEVPEPEEEDDDEGWITPGNIRTQKSKPPPPTPAQPIEVACMTSDFAMQNVLLQIGLHAVSPDGTIIKKLKTFILRCHACFKTTFDMDKLFCPSCGGPTLSRVTARINDQGELEYFLKKNYQHRLRGTIYSLPAPKGGRNAGELILREDQKEYQRAAHKKKRNMEKALKDDDRLLFFEGGLASRHDQDAQFGHGRKNPNIARRVVHKKKKGR